MRTYNEEIDMAKTNYLKFCKEKSLPINNLLNIFLFLKESKLDQTYENKGEFINDLIEAIKQETIVLWKECYEDCDNCKDLDCFKNTNAMDDKKYFNYYRSK